MSKDQSASRSDDVKPKTPLPWTTAVPYNAPIRSANYEDVFYLEPDYEGGHYIESDPQDRAYVVHACNEYPKLMAEVARLRAAVSERGASSEELARLREIEHLAWHLMDDSEENARTGKVTIKPMREDYDKLAALLPEEHPGEVVAAPAKPFYCEEKLGDRCAMQCSVCAEGQQRYERNERP